MWHSLGKNPFLIYIQFLPHWKTSSIKFDLYTKCSSVWLCSVNKNSLSRRRVLIFVVCSNYWKKSQFFIYISICEITHSILKLKIILLDIIFSSMFLMVNEHRIVFLAKLCNLTCKIRKIYFHSPITKNIQWPSPNLKIFKKYICYSTNSQVPSFQQILNIPK